MEKEEFVNIPRDVEDSHYRYRMPILNVKIEGRGNGIKTRLINIVEISKALDRPTTYVVKFFGFELGAQVIIPPIPEGQFLVNGKHDANDLAKLLDRFIEKYVLCGGCRNPETVIMIKREAPRMRCKACGRITVCDVSHKIANYIVKFPPIDPTQKETTEDDIYDNSIPEDVDDDWAVSVEPEEVAKRQLALSGGLSSILWDDCDEIIPADVWSPYQREEEVRTISPVIRKITPIENPLPVLSQYWETCPRDSDVTFNLENVAKFCKWTDEVMLRNIFASLWMDFKPEGAILKGHYLSLFVKDESSQKQIFRYMEKMATENKNFAISFQDILAMFWQERVLEEEVIKKWYTHPNPKTPEKVSKFIRDRCEKFIKWLAQPEGDELPRINRL